MKSKKVSTTFTVLSMAAGMFLTPASAYAEPLASGQETVVDSSDVSTDDSVSEKTDSDSGASETPEKPEDSSSDTSKEPEEKDDSEDPAPTEPDVTPSVTPSVTPAPDPLQNLDTAAKQQLLLKLLTESPDMAALLTALAGRIA